MAGATAAGFAAWAGWGFELFSHFRLQYLLAASVLGLIFLLCGRRRAAVAAVVVMAVNGAALTPLYLPSAQAAVDANKQTLRELRVLSLNVFFGNRDVQRVMRYVQRENPDVLVLLEITEPWREPLEQLARRYRFHWIHPGNDRTGIAVLSRVAPEQTRLINLGDDVVSLLMTLSGPAGTRLSILGTHLSAPLSGASARLRNRQLASLAQVAREHPWPLVIVGDLNVTPFSPLFARTLRDGKLSNCSGKGWHPTWPARVVPLFIQIDHCLSGNAAVTRNFRVGPAVGSDHYPIAVRVGFAKP